MFGDERKRASSWHRESARLLALKDRSESHRQERGRPLGKLIKIKNEVSKCIENSRLKLDQIEQMRSTVGSTASQLKDLRLDKHNLLARYHRLEAQLAFWRQQSQSILTEDRCYRHLLDRTRQSIVGIKQLIAETRKRVQILKLRQSQASLLSEKQVKLRNQVLFRMKQKFNSESWTCKKLNLIFREKLNFITQSELPQAQRGEAQRAESPEASPLAKELYCHALLRRVLDSAMRRLVGSTSRDLRLLYQLQMLTKEENLWDIKDKIETVSAKFEELLLLVNRQLQARKQVAEKNKRLRSRVGELEAQMDSIESQEAVSRGGLQVGRLGRRSLGAGVRSSSIFGWVQKQLQKIEPCGELFGAIPGFKHICRRLRDQLLAE